MCVILPRVVLFLKVITKTKTLEAKKAGTFVVSRDRCCPPLFLAANISLKSTYYRKLNYGRAPPPHLPSTFFEHKKH